MAQLLSDLSITVREHIVKLSGIKTYGLRILFVLSWLILRVLLHKTFTENPSGEKMAD